MELATSRVLELVREQTGAVLIPLPVGIGKSYATDNILVEVCAGNTEYDVVILAAPTHKIIDERRILNDTNNADTVFRLRGRPNNKCGEQRNAEWRSYEMAASYMLGKQQVCGSCPEKSTCSWAEQFSLIDEHTRVVLMPQAYLDVDPNVLMRIIKKTGATNPLILLDEINFSQKMFKRSIKSGVIANYIQVLKEFTQRFPENKSAVDYLHMLGLLVASNNDDLASPGWQFYPLEHDDTCILQQMGIDLYGDNFTFPGNDLMTFAHQHPGYRTKCSDGDLEYQCIPYLEGGLGKVVIFSGTASKLLLEHRLGIELAELYSDYEFRHHESCFYNINSGSGIEKNYAAHFNNVMDFVVQYIMSKFRQNKDVVLVTKQKSVEKAIEALNKSFILAGLTKVIAVPALEWNKSDDMVKIPVLHYGGAIGFNDLGGFDCVLCVKGYYIPSGVLNDTINEVCRADCQVPYHIKTIRSSAGFLRRVPVPSPEAPFLSDYSIQLATAVIEQEEMGVVIQAIGRVRPFTKPREVVTFQCGESRLMPYDKEFTSLKEARQFFGLKTARTLTARLKTYVPIKFCKFMGLSRQETVACIKRSKRTVDEHWNH